MRVLIGSNGGLVGIYLARRYKQMKDVVLFGADCTAKCAGRFFVDRQFVVPSATSKGFIEDLIRILNENKIDVYLPTHSTEIKVVSKYAEILRGRTEARFLVSPFTTFELLGNKRSANVALREVGIPVPKLIENDKCNYPILMKPDVSSGSRGIFKIENNEIHEALKRIHKDYSFYQFINGREFTVDCMFDAKGKLIGANQRRREKTIGGAVSITTNSDECDISLWLKIFERNWIFRGCINLQYILLNNTPYFTDVNLRYPSGGLPLTVESGLDIPKLTLKVLYNEPVEIFVRSDKFKNLTMYRYFEEIFDK